MNAKIKRIISSYVRLGYAFLACLFSLLAVLEAPTRLLWLAAILATEYGHLLAFATLPVLLPGWRHSILGRLSVLFAGIAFVLLQTPVLRAFAVAKQLPDQWERAFGKSSNQMHSRAIRTKPLALSALFAGVDFPTVKSTTVVYDSVGDISLTLDLYVTRKELQPRPGVLIVHGGAWRTGDSKQSPELNNYLASQGYVVAALNYRLAPRWRYPAQLEDISAALTYLKAHALQLSLDPDRLVLLGRSAGAHLALQSAYKMNDRGIRGAVAFYGPHDLHYGYTHPANPLVIDSKKVLEDFLGGNPAEMPACYHEASPINHVTAASPPTLLLHGGRDELVSPEQSRRLAERLREERVPHFYLKLPWATHGCDFNFSGPSGQIALYAVERFIAETTAKATSFSRPRAKRESD